MTNQGIRVLAKFYDVIIFGPKINYDLTTLTLSQQPFSSHNFFRQNQARCRVIIFPQVSSHIFWQHGACARNTVMKKNNVQSACCRPGPFSSHNYFSPGPAGHGQVIIFIWADTAGPGRVIIICRARKELIMI